jgi:hypothetical protein
VVLDLEGVSPGTLVDALALPAYEAALLVRRGGFHLHRVLDVAAAEEEASRLVACGARVVLIPEAEARVRPVRAVGGERGEGLLTLRTEEGAVALRRAALLVVQGDRGVPAPALRPAEVDTARLDEGWFHLPAEAAGLRPVGSTQPPSVRPRSGSGGSARPLGGDPGRRPCDGGFRRLPPPSDRRSQGKGPSPPGTLGLVAPRTAREAAPLVLATSRSSFSDGEPLSNVGAPTYAPTVHEVGVVVLMNGRNASARRRLSARCAPLLYPSEP